MLGPLSAPVPLDKLNQRGLGILSPLVCPLCTDLVTWEAKGEMFFVASGDLPHFAGEDLMHVGSFVCSDLESQESSEPLSRV